MKGFLRKVLLIASVGATMAFYGCTKDFTQDIEDVRKDLIAALEQQNAALTASINQAKQDAQKYADQAAQAAKDYADKVADAAAKKAEAAQAAADAAQKAADAAQATGNEAKQKAEDAQRAADAAKEAAEAAQKAAEDALTEAKKYADNVAAQKATEAYQKAISELKPQIEQALADAKTYADARLQDAKDYADSLKDALELKLSDLESKLQGAIDGLEESLNGLTGRVDGLEESLSNLTGRLESEIKRLDDEIAGIKISISDLKAEDEAIKVRLKALEDFKASIETWKEQVTEDLARISSDLEKLTGDLKNLSSSLEALQAQVEALDSRLSQQIEDLNTKIDNVSKNLTEYVDGKIAELKEELAGLDKKINGVIDQLAALSLELKEEIANLRIELLEKIKEEASNSQERDQQLQAQIDDLKALLESYKDELDAKDQYLEGKIDTLGEELRKEIETAISNLDSKLTDYINQEIEKLADLLGNEIDTLRNELLQKESEIYARIDAEVQKLNEAIDTLRKEMNELFDSVEEVIKNRITSISLIPEMYIGGVESVNVPVLFYTPLAVSDNEAIAKLDVVNALPWHTSTAIRYHVSPSNVTVDCIADALYLTENATFVKSLGEEIITVLNKEVNKDNELVVSVRRVNQENVIPYSVSDFTKFSQAKWPTVALSLAIANDYLIDGTEANVVSEYSAYTETAGSIHITQKAAPCEQSTCSKFYESYKTMMIDDFMLVTGACEGDSFIPVVYDQTLNLRELLAAHAKLSNENFGTIIEDINVLRSMGLDYRFSIPTEPNLAKDGTDQQAFIRFADESNEVIASLVPGGYENNPASVGRTPVVRVELYDINTNQVVDVQWIKIKWVRDSIPAQDFGLIKSFEQILDCSKLFEFSIDWKTINEKILAAGLSMSHEQFVDLYGSATVSVDPENTTVDPVGYARAYFVRNTSPVQPQTSVYKVTVDHRGLVNVIKEILENGKATRTVTVRVVPKTTGDTQVGEIKFSVNIDWTLPAELLPTINGYKLTNSWTVAEQLAMVEPIGFSDKTNTQPAVKQFVRYDFNMKGLFNLDTKGGFVANLVPEQEGLDFSCRTWDMQFSSDMEGYGEVTNLFRPSFFSNPAILYAKDTYKTGYELINKSTRKMVAKFVYPSTVENWYNSEEKVNSLKFTVAKLADNDQVTKILNPVNVADDIRVKLPVNVWSMLTPAFTNVYKVKTFDLWVVSPVKMPELKDMNLSLADINMNVSQVILPNGTALFKEEIKDFQNNPIDTDLKKKYYGVVLPTWMIDNRTANYEILTDIIIDENNNITVNPELNPNDYASAAEAKRNMRNLSKAGFDAKFDGTTLKVTNKQGAALTQTVTFWIPLAYEHAYQKFFTYIPVTYKPNSETPAN